MDISRLLSAIFPTMIVAGLATSLIGCVHNSANRAGVHDFTRADSYSAPCLPIEPAGYFALGLRYVHAPRVEWQPVPGAASYELLLLQHGKVLAVTKASQSPRFIEQGWDRIKPGAAAVVIKGYDAQGKLIALSRMFPLIVVPDFNPRLAAGRKRPYKEAAWLAFDALCNVKLPESIAPKDGPGAGLQPVLLSAAFTPSTGAHYGYSFPSLHDWMYVEMVARMLQIADTPAQKERLLKFGRDVGDHLLLSRLPVPDNVYGGLVRGCVDFYGNSALGVPVQDLAQAAKMKRLVEPAKSSMVAAALVQVHELTGDSKYLEAAFQMAEVFVRTQAPDGSWPARVDGQTGEVLGEYTSAVGMIGAFLDRINQLRPDPRWVTARDRALAWMSAHPMQTYAWVINFDDCGAGGTKANPFGGNLSNWDLLSFARYLAAHPERIDRAADRLREQLDWVDNQFVFYDRDDLLLFEPFYPTVAEQGNPRQNYLSVATCWQPMDFHTANWVSTMIAMYRLTGESIWLEKARAGANALTQYQLDSGATHTWMPDRHYGLTCGLGGTGFGDNFWPAGWAMSAAVWAELAAIEEGR